VRQVTYSLASPGVAARCASAGRGAPMHVARAVSLHWSRGSRPSAAAAGLREPAARLRALGCRLFCLPLDLGGQKLHIWCLLIFVVCSAALCIGLFEAERLTTHVLRSPCTVIGSELVDVGTCTVCDELSPSNCEEHPVATARLAVTFRPMHRDANVTGSVWYCKGRQESDPCDLTPRFLDQLTLDARATSVTSRYARGSQVPCTAGEVYSYMQANLMEGSERECYYSSRDHTGQDVWLSMPAPGLVDHEWFQRHLEYPVLLALGGLVLLSVLFGCLALEGAELWAAGLV